MERSDQLPVKPEDSLLRELQTGLALVAKMEAARARCEALVTALAALDHKEIRVLPWKDPNRPRSVSWNDERDQVVIDGIRNGLRFGAIGALLDRSRGSVGQRVAVLRKEGKLPPPGIP